MNVSEMLGFLTGATSVWLAVKENVWNWPIGIANSAFFLVLFWTAHLYANSGLQVLYIGLGLYGWWNWRYGGAERSILHERYLGTPSEAVRSIAASRSYAIYVLTDSDIPFVQDGLRDGEHVREWMTRRFREELEARRSRWICVSGAHEQRLEAAVAAIDALPERATHE